jgi:hypothetical protein
VALAGGGARGGGEALATGGDLAGGGPAGRLPVCGWGSEGACVGCDGAWQQAVVAGCCTRCAGAWAEKDAWAEKEGQPLGAYSWRGPQRRRGTGSTTAMPGRQGHDGQN